MPPDFVYDQLWATDFVDAVFCSLENNLCVTLCVDTFQNKLFVIDSLRMTYFSSFCVNRILDKHFSEFCVWVTSNNLFLRLMCLTHLEQKTFLKLLYVTASWTTLFSSLLYL